MGAKFLIAQILISAFIFEDLEKFYGLYKSLKINLKTWFFTLIQLRCWRIELVDKMNISSFWWQSNKLMFEASSYFQNWFILLMLVSYSFILEYKNLIFEKVKLFGSVSRNSRCSHFKTYFNFCNNSFFKT